MSSIDPPSGVRIGNVTGGIHGSVIAGRDVSNAVITIGGHPTPANKQPDFDEIKLLLSEIQRELQTLSSNEKLKQISPATPFLAQGAAQTVTEAATKLEATMAPGVAESVHHSLTEATSLLSTILEGAKTVGTTIDQAGPLIEKVGVAALWVARMWM